MRLELVDGRRVVRLIYAANSDDAVAAAMRGRCYVRDIALVSVTDITLQMHEIASRVMADVDRNRIFHPGG